MKRRFYPSKTVQQQPGRVVEFGSQMRPIGEMPEAPTGDCVCNIKPSFVILQNMLTYGWAQYDEDAYSFTQTSDGSGETVDVKYDSSVYGAPNKFDVLTVHATGKFDTVPDDDIPAGYRPLIKSTPDRLIDYIRINTFDFGFGSSGEASDAVPFLISFYGDTACNFRWHAEWDNLLAGYPPEWANERHRYEIGGGVIAVYPSSDQEWPWWAEDAPPPGWSPGDNKLTVQLECGGEMLPPVVLELFWDAG